MISEKLKIAIRLIKSGNKQAAQPILKEILRADPGNEKAWLWLFACTEKVGQKRYFLQQALRIDPGNQNIQRELLKLKSQPHIVAWPIHLQKGSSTANSLENRGPISQNRQVARKTSLDGLPTTPRYLLQIAAILNDAKSAFRFIFSKLAWVGLVIFGVSVLTFLLIHNIPGNPWQASTDQRALFNIVLDPAALRQLDRQFGLDQPLWKQYASYMFGSHGVDGDFSCGAICGNLGPSFRQRGGKVVNLLFGVPKGVSFWHSRFGYTARLALLAFLFTALVGIPLGISMAFQNGSRIQQAISALLSLVLATPNFVLGILLIIIFASWLKLVSVVPAWDKPQAWIMPVVVLAAIPTANLAGLTQTAIREAVQGDYVRTAYAKGLRRFRVITGHVLPNALVPIVTALAPVLIELVAGSFIVEALFSFPGIGREYWQSINELDYPVIMALTLLYSLGIVSINVIVESLYGFLDPRLRQSGSQ